MAPDVPNFWQIFAIWDSWTFPASYELGDIWYFQLFTFIIGLILSIMYALTYFGKSSYGTFKKPGEYLTSYDFKPSLKYRILHILPPLIFIFTIFVAYQFPKGYGWIFGVVALILEAVFIFDVSCREWWIDTLDYDIEKTKTNVRLKQYKEIYNKYLNM